MGLAERFKNRLDNRDIFTKTNIEKQFKEQDIEFISKPITHETNIQPKEKTLHQPDIVLYFSKSK